MSSLAVGNVINCLLELNGITEAALAKAVNMPRATINKICSGKIQTPRADTLIMIANYFGITIDQLVGSVPLNRDRVIKFIQIPMLELDYISSLPRESKFESLGLLDYPNCLVLEASDKYLHNSKSLFAVKITSDAMIPYFDEKTTVIVDERAPVANRKYVLVRLADTSEVILRQIFIDGNSKILKPINSIFKTVELTANDLILGVVIQTKRDF